MNTLKLNGPEHRAFLIALGQNPDDPEQQKKLRWAIEMAGNDNWTPPDFWYPGWEPRE